VLICPNCRSENLEEAQFCHQCGRSLEPADMALRPPAREEGEVAELDVGPLPKQRSALPGILVVVVLLLAGGGFWLWSSLRPDPCAGKYSSVLFSYCTEVPAGWEGGSQLAGTENMDRFVPTAYDAATSVTVDEVVDPTAATQSYAQQFRINQIADGLSLGRSQAVEIDGEQAIGWDVTVPTEAEGILQLRDVVLVREDGAWHIRLLSPEVDYQTARLAFEDLLANWVWK
jgi:hypothetical protein